MTTTIVRHVGKKGDTGTTGENGSGVQDIRYSLVDSPAIDIFKSNKVSDAVTWTRQDEAAFTDRYGNEKFIAGDSFKQFVKDSIDFANVTNWEDPDSNWSVTQDQNQTDPLGGSLASEITFTNTTSSVWGMLGSMTSGASGGDIFRFSFYAKLISGSISSVEVQFGGASAEILEFPQTISGTWQRFSILVQPASAGTTFRLFFRTTGAVINLFGVNVTTGTILHDYVEALNISSTQTINNTEPVWRESEKGYLIEGEATNICPQSQDLTTWNTTGSPVIDQYTSAEAHGFLNLPILVAFSSNQSITIFRNDLTLTSGQVYSISLFAKRESGNIESLSVSLGGGAPQALEITEDFTRQSIEVTAGSQSTITFTATSTTSGSSFVLTSIQVEDDKTSSYIPTGPLAVVREAELVSIDGAILPSFNQPYTIQFAWREMSFYDGMPLSFAFNTNSGFGVVFSFANGDNRVHIRTSSLPNSAVSLYSPGQSFNSGGEVTIVFDGLVWDFYDKAEFIKSESSVGLTLPSEQQTIAYIGSVNAAGAQSMNAYIKDLKIWDFAMTEAEVKYASGEYQTNRFSDRG